MLRPRSFGVWSATTSVSWPLASNVTSTWTLPHRLLSTAPSTTDEAGRAAWVVGAAVAGAVLCDAFVACDDPDCDAAAGDDDGEDVAVGASVPDEPATELVRTTAADPAEVVPAPAAFPVANSATSPAVDATLSPTAAIRARAAGCR